MKITTIFCYLLLVVSFSFCKKNKDSDTDNASTTSYVVKGTVKDAQGKPLAGAKVIVENTNSILSYRSVSVLTGTDGSYSIQLPKEVGSAWQAFASITKTYLGKTYTMDLFAENPNDFLASDGATCNFTWKLTGEKVGRLTGKFGASLSVGSEIGGFYDYENVEMTFTPTAPLIDGSSIPAFKRKLTSTQLVEDLPLGQYTVTATYLKPSSQPVAMRIRKSNSGAFAASHQVDFDPEKPTCKNCYSVDIIE